MGDEGSAIYINSNIHYSINIKSVKRVEENCKTLIKRTTGVFCAVLC